MFAQSETGETESQAFSSLNLLNSLFFIDIMFMSRAISSRMGKAAGL